MAVYDSIAAHRPMALDAVRNAAYAAALRRVITPESVVLDLGAGTGVLGLIAARLGARRVYMVEPSPVIAVAEELAAANGLQDVVTPLRGRIEDVELPERVDVIVSVMTGNFLLAEDLLPSLFLARDRWLKPDGHLVPDRAVMEVAPVSAPDLHAAEIAGWSIPQEAIDLWPLRNYAANTVFYTMGLRSARFLGEPVPLLDLDFLDAAYEPLRAEAVTTVLEAADCHGIAGWFRMRLGDRWLSTSPHAPRVHWSSAFLPLDPPMFVSSDEQLSITIGRPPRGDWNWQVRTAAGHQRHSLTLASPMTTELLRRASREYVPVRTTSLDAVAFVLAHVDGVRDVYRLAGDLRARYPERYPMLADAIEFTQRVVGGF